MYKQYAVYAFSKHSNQSGRLEIDRLFNDYEEAYEHMHEACQDLNNMPAPIMPAKEVPLRQEGANMIVELWIISRTA
jgi:uncharacterized membrane-anchored protein YhcB (DUF1043 family)